MIFIVWLLGVIVALFVLAIVFLPMLVDEAQIIALAEEAVQEETGGEFRVEGDTNLSLFPRFEIELGDTTLILPAKTDFDASISAKIATLDIGLSVLAMLSGETQVGAIRLSGVRATVTQAKLAPVAPSPTPVLSDQAWERLGSKLRTERAVERQRLLEEVAPATAISIGVDEIAIEDVQIIINRADGSLSNMINIERLALSQVNTQGRAMTIEAFATLTFDTDQRLEITSNGSIRLPSDLSKVNLDRLETHITGVFNEPMTTIVSGELVLSPLRADIALDAQLPGGNVDGKLIYADLESPQIAVTLGTQRLDLDKLNSTTADPDNTEPVPAALPLPIGPLQGLDLKLDINAGTLLTAGQTISNAQVALRVIDGIAKFDAIRGALHRGQLDAVANINVRRPMITASIEGGLRRFDLNSLASSFGAADQVSGLTDMTWHIDTKGESATALQIGLDGDLTLTGNNVVIETASIQAGMCLAAAQINQQSLTSTMPTTTPIKTLEMVIDFDDGAAKIDTLAMTITGASLSGAGSVALDSLDFRTALVAQLNNELTEIDPNCRLDERYASIDWPVVCKGNLNGEPKKWCRINTDSILQQIIEREAKSQLQKQSDKLGKKAGKLLKNLFGN